MLSLLNQVNSRVAEHKDIKMDHIYEMNKQRFDEQIVNSYIQSDRLERGKKDITGAPKAIEDEETIKSRKLLQQMSEHQKLTMGVMEKAREYYQTTNQKYKRDKEQMKDFVE